ncbi:hypothetical protein ACLM5H_18255 [Fredinandcohnia humi]
MKNYHEDKPYLSHSLKSLDQDLVWNKDRKQELERKISKDIDKHISKSQIRKRFHVWVPSIITVTLCIGGLFFILNNLLSEKDQATPNVETKTELEEPILDTIESNSKINKNTRELLKKNKNEINIPLDLHNGLSDVIRGEPSIRVNELNDGLGLTATYPIAYGTLFVSQSTKYPNLAKEYNEQDLINEMISVHGDENITVTELNGFTTILVEQSSDMNMIRIYTNYNIYTLSADYLDFDELLEIAKLIKFDNGT